MSKMREHKYRAWNRQEQKMYRVNSLLLGIENGMGTMGTSGIVDLVMLDGKDRCYVVGEDVDLIQFTGFKDRDGEDVFEWHILESEHGQRGIVKWVHSGFVIAKADGTEYYLLGDNMWDIIGHGCEYERIVAQCAYDIVTQKVVQ